MFFLLQGRGLKESPLVPLKPESRTLGPVGQAKFLLFAQVTGAVTISGELPVESAAGVHSPAELPATVSGDCGVLSKSAGRLSSFPAGNALGGADGGREVPDWCAPRSPSSGFVGNGERLGGGEHEENHPLEAQETVTAQSQTVFRKPSSV